MKSNIYIAVKGKLDSAWMILAQTKSEGVAEFIRDNYKRAYKENNIEREVRLIRDLEYENCYFAT